MDQGGHKNASMSVPMKRGRGRPRKYPIIDPSGNSRAQRDPNSSSSKNANVQGTQANHGEIASVPPGFETANGNQTLQGSNQGGNDIMVGQVVSGVVEAVFDAGCLLTVRVGNSPTVLRGVVLRPGHYVPVSAENDVAPNVQMIRRKEIPLPMVNAAQVLGHTSQAKEKNLPLIYSQGNGTSNSPSIPENTTPDANSSVSKEAYTPPMTQAATPLNVGGSAMPVFTQSTYVSNTALLSNQLSQVAAQTAYPTTLGNQVASSAHPSNVLASTTNQQPAADSLLQSHTQTSHPTVTQSHMEVNSITSPRMSFQNLLTEVMKRVESPSQAVDPQAEVSVLVSKSPANESGDTREKERNPPLQAVESSHQNYSAPVPNSSSSEQNRTDKMSELLRVLQENYEGNKNPEAQEPKAGCISKSDERAPDAKFGDSQTNDSK